MPTSIPMKRLRLGVLVGIALLLVAGCHERPRTGIAASPQRMVPAATGSARAVAAPVIVTVSVGAGGFTPSRIQAQAGRPLTLRFVRTTDQTCATEVVFEHEGIKKALPLNQPVDITLTPQGEIAFSCGMGMLRGAVVAS